jgi:hypothetical protein
MKKNNNLFNYIILAATVIAVAVVFFEARKPAMSPQQSEPAEIAPLPATPATALLYYSTAKKTDFCDGDNMDSAGYGKTIDKNVAFPLPQTLKTPEDKFLYLMNAGANYIGDEYSCPGFFVKDLQAKFRNGTAYLFNPGGGWAGVSIAMCTCEPFLDYNLSRSFGISKTSWVDTQTEWDALK